MAQTVNIPTPLRRFTNGQEIVTASGGTVDEIFNQLESQFPGRVEGHDPFTSVACGLAIANFRGLDCRLE